MTVAELQERALTRAGELSGAGAFHTPAQALYALNMAQWVFVLLTLCLEKTGTLALDAGVSWYALLRSFGDFILPLRVRVVDGLALRPGRLAEFDARNMEWQSAAGTPGRYACLGFDLMAISPRPAASGTSLTITYAASPVRLISAADTPQVPAEDHPALEDFAICWLRAKEGGETIAQTRPELERFFKAVKQRAAYVRARNQAQRYDRVPPELQRIDLSRLFRQVRKPWPTMLDSPLEAAQSSQPTT